MNIDASESYGYIALPPWKPVEIIAPYVKPEPLPLDNISKNWVEHRSGGTTFHCCKTISFETNGTNHPMGLNYPLQCCLMVTESWYMSDGEQRQRVVRHEHFTACDYSHLTGVMGY